MVMGIRVGAGLGEARGRDFQIIIVLGPVLPCHWHSSSHRSSCLAHIHSACRVARYRTRVHRMGIPCIPDPRDSLSFLYWV